METRGTASQPRATKACLDEALKSNTSHFPSWHPKGLLSRQDSVKEEALLPATSGALAPAERKGIGVAGVEASPKGEVLLGFKHRI